MILVCTFVHAFYMYMTHRSILTWSVNKIYIYIYLVLSQTYWAVHIEQLSYQGIPCNTTGHGKFNNKEMATGALYMITFVKVRSAQLLHQNLLQVIAQSPTVHYNDGHMRFTNIYIYKFVILMLNIVNYHYDIILNRRMWFSAMRYWFWGPSQFPRLNRHCMRSLAKCGFISRYIYIYIYI